MNWPEINVPAWWMQIAEQWAHFSSHAISNRTHDKFIHFPLSSPSKFSHLFNLSASRKFISIYLYISSRAAESFCQKVHLSRSNSFVRVARDLICPGNPTEAISSASQGDRIFPAIEIFHLFRALFLSRIYGAVCCAQGATLKVLPREGKSGSSWCSSSIIPPFFYRWWWPRNFSTSENLPDFH